MGQLTISCLVTLVATKEVVGPRKNGLLGPNWQATKLHHGPLCQDGAEQGSKIITHVDLSYGPTNHAIFRKFHYSCQISSFFTCKRPKVKTENVKNGPKCAKNSKTKIFKNPPKIQFWSNYKKPYVKINQKSKTFQIFQVKLVWPQFLNSPDLLWRI